MPETYGNRITIQRTVTLVAGAGGKTSASSRYALSGVDNTVHAHSAKDVEALCEFLSINPSNPLQYMSQEDMKSFSQASPEQLYDFLSTGTCIAQMGTDLHNSAEMIAEMGGALRSQQKNVEVLKDNFQQAKDAAHMTESIADNDRMLAEARKAAAWAEVEALDAALGDTRDEIERLRRSKDKLEAAAGGVEAEMAELAEQVEALRRRRAELSATRKAASERVAALNAEYDDKFASRLKSLKEQTATAARAAKLARRQQAQTETKMKQLQTQLRAIPGQEEVTEAMDQHSAATAEADTLLAELGKRRAALADEALQTLRGRLEGSKATLESASHRSKTSALRLQQLKSSRGAEVTIAPGMAVPESKLMAVDGMAMRVRGILDANARRFSRPVIGPVGATMALRPGMQAVGVAVESALRRVMTGYIAASHADCVTAMQLCRANGIRRPPSFICPPEVPEARRPEFTAPGKAVPGCFSLFEVLDAARMPWSVVVAIADSMALHKMRFTARTATDPRFGPDTSKAGQVTVFAHDGSSYRFNPVTKSQSRTPGEEREGSVLASSDKSVLAALTREAAEAKAAVEAARQEAEADRAALAAEEERHGKLARAMESAKARWQAAVAEARRLGEEAEAVRRSADTADGTTERIQAEIMSLEQDLARGKQLEADAEESVELRKAKHAAVVSEAQPLLAEVRAAKAEAEERAGVSDLQEQEEALGDRIREKQGQVRNLRNKSIREKQDALEAARELLAKDEARLGALRTAVQQSSGMDTAPEAAALGVEACRQEVVMLEQAGKIGRQRLEESGLDIDQVKADMVAAREALRQAESRVADLTKARANLQEHKKSFGANRVRRITRIERKASEKFAQVMEVRGHQGCLSFEEGADKMRRCVVSVTPHAVTQSTQASGTQGEDDDDDAHEEGDDGMGNRAMDLGTLSGGEKSLTAVSLLLAFGDAGQAPWRMFDEFDVFMDEANRKLAMEQLSAFGSKMGRQLICLTPLGISGVINESDNVSIRHIAAPVRGLVPMAEEAGSASAAATAPASSAAAASAAV